MRAGTSTVADPSGMVARPESLVEPGARYVVVGYGASGGPMKFFIDTADVKEIREAAAMGLVDGVTTNPSLVAKTGRKFRDVLLEICDIVKGPVSAEVVGAKYDDMMKEARELAALRNEHRRQDPDDRRGHEGGAHVHRRGHQDQRHAVLLGDPGAARGQGRRDVHLAVRRSARRRLDRRHAADRRDPRRSTRTTTSRPRCSSPRCATRCTCSRRRCWARTSRRVRSRCCCSSSKHPLTDIGLKKFLEDWEKVPK